MDLLLATRERANSRVERERGERGKNDTGKRKINSRLARLFYTLAPADVAEAAQIRWKTPYGHAYMGMNLKLSLSKTRMDNNNTKVLNNQSFSPLANENRCRLMLYMEPMLLACFDTNTTTSATTWPTRNAIRKKTASGRRATLKTYIQ